MGDILVRWCRPSSHVSRLTSSKNSSGRENTLLWSHDWCLPSYLFRASPVACQNKPKPWIRKNRTQGRQRIVEPVKTRKLKNSTCLARTRVGLCIEPFYSPVLFVASGNPEQEHLLYACIEANVIQPTIFGTFSAREIVLIEGWPHFWLKCPPAATYISILSWSHDFLVYKKNRIVLWIFSVITADQEL